MNKSILSVSTLLFIAMTSYAHGNARHNAHGHVRHNAHGKMYYGKQTVSSVDFAGKVTMDGTTVTGDTHISGQLIANDAHLNTLNIDGSGKLTHSDVKGKSSIQGSLKPNHASFGDDLSVTADNFILTSTQTKNIIINQSDSRCEKNQSVSLQQSSEVNGNITFKCNHGTVYVSKDSKLGGRVIGGNVVSS